MLSQQGESFFFSMSNLAFVSANCFLPSCRHCSYDFMLQICGGKKRVFEWKDIAIVAVRNHKELRMRTILKQVLPHDLRKSYLPQKKREVYKVDEWFDLTVVAKLEPEWFDAIVKATFETRH